MNAISAPIETPLRGFLREFTQDRVAVVALVVLALIVLLALLAPWITPQNPYDLADLVLMDARRPPGYVGSKGFTHWLGTDAQGRDLLSAILYGLRISLQVGLMAGAIAFALGASLGTLAGFVGGRIETLIMRIIDLQLSFPAILLALVLAALLGQGRWPLIVALVTAQYAYFARTAHGAASSERSKDYVEAALSTPPQCHPRGLSPCAAQLPAAADCGGHGAGRQLHRAGGYAVVPRPGHAGVRALAGHADRQWF